MTLSTMMRLLTVLSELLSLRLDPLDLDALLRVLATITRNHALAEEVECVFYMLHLSSFFFVWLKV